MFDKVGNCILGCFSGIGRSEEACSFRRINVMVAVVTGVLFFIEHYIYIQHLNGIPDKGVAQAAAMQTENAFYYSYYNELVHTKSISQGFEQIIWDRRSEYPDVLNALRRFNIYQEVVMALIYRAMRSIGLGWVDPWDFFRYTILVLNACGQSAMSLLAAEISGNPVAGVSCFLASVLNRFQISRLGNFSSSNLRELWGTPILWMQTLCLWRLVHGGAPHAIREKPRKWLWFSFVALTLAFIIVWQFSPFLLLLQATALYFVYLVCGYRELRPLVVGVIDSYLLATFLAVGIHFGSPYLLTSPFLYQLLALKASLSLCVMRRSARQPVGFVRWATSRFADVGEGLIALVVFALIQKAMKPFSTADTHIYDILCTKVAAVNNLLPKRLQLPDHRLPDCAEPSFNARLYLIMGVFNLLEKSSLKIYYDSTAGPAAGLACLLVVARFVFGACSRLPFCGDSYTAEDHADVDVPTSVANSSEATVGTGLRKRNVGKAQGPSAEKSNTGPKSAKSKKDTNGKEVFAGRSSHGSYEEAALLVFIVQFLFFFLLGALINRLRAVFGPPMMVLAAACFGPRLFPFRWVFRRCRNSLLIVLMLVFSMHCVYMAMLLPCVSNDDGICQHLSDKSGNDGDVADLSDWVNRALPPAVPILTSMNLAGSLRLFTSASLIVHPQFESENLRKRVQLGYELYHCGSAASFAQTMRKLKADIVIFEYFRCFFTPYILDDRRKNCDSKKHKPEDQLCVKLHTSQQLFTLIFANGGFAVFRLNAPQSTSEGLPQEHPASRVAGLLATSETWEDYIKLCTQQQGAACGPRLMEAAATWHHSLKRLPVAHTLRRLALKAFPEDGYVQYYMGRHYDYEAEKPELASPHYKTAVKMLPNNPLIVKEYLMFLDLALKDHKTLTRLLKAYQAGNNKGRTPFLEMNGPGVGALLCEASINAKNTPGMEKLGDAMWTKARQISPLSDCVKHNWQLYYNKNNYDDLHPLWTRVRLMAAGGTQHHIGPHNQPAVRFQGDKLFLTSPFNNTG